MRKQALVKIRTKTGIVLTIFFRIQNVNRVHGSNKSKKSTLVSENTLFVFVAGEGFEPSSAAGGYEPDELMRKCFNELPPSSTLQPFFSFHCFCLCSKILHQNHFPWTISCAPIFFAQEIMRKQALVKIRTKTGIVLTIFFRIQNVNRVHGSNKSKKSTLVSENTLFVFVAGEGFEPSTFGL